jgi:hypothetical protein
MLVLTVAMRSSAGTMRSSLQENIWQSDKSALDRTRVRSIAQEHCAWSEGCARTQPRTNRAQTCNCAVNGATALDRNRGAIDRTYRVCFSRNPNRLRNSLNKHYSKFFFGFYLYKSMKQIK